MCNIFQSKLGHIGTMGISVQKGLKILAHAKIHNLDFKYSTRVSKTYNVRNEHSEGGWNTVVKNSPVKVEVG